ncbi:GYD domain-containing protein [Ramlibacter humi]|uniref:GYD domain-containing protein n=1 Tax=Ramlibacter humi TaxID=2530451 RepID=A0A4Z0CCH6_9BURK|nr:GYD domain-containing protein [Ramlibacter humi]TFZ07809.1 GYD domain-containing protein [Ramlibacter humi]
MATYIALCKFTDQGIRTVRDTVKRADAAREMAGRFGVQMTDIYWTLGKYDLVVECTAKDDDSLIAFNLALSSAGNVRMQTLRALDRGEMEKVLGKLTQ